MPLEGGHVNADADEQAALLVEVLLVIGDDLGQCLAVHLGQLLGERSLLVAHAGMGGQVSGDAASLPDLGLDHMIQHFGRDDVAELLGHEEVGLLDMLLDDIGDVVPVEIERDVVDVVERCLVDLLECGDDAVDPCLPPVVHELGQLIADVECGGECDDRDTDGGKFENHLGSNLCRVVLRGDPHK